MTATTVLPAPAAAPASCPRWCVADHADPHDDGAHVSRAAAFTAPSDMEADGEFLAAELFRDDSQLLPRTALSLNHAGNGVLLDVAGVDQAIEDLVGFVFDLLRLRGEMTGAVS